MLATSSPKVPSSMCKICQFTSSCTCAKSHPGICSPLKHSIILSADSAVRAWPSLSTYARRQVFAWRGPCNNLQGKVGRRSWPAVKVL